MRTRTPHLILATAVVAAMAASPAAAQTEPTSEAGATAVVVDGVLTISGTNATTEGDGSADATVIGLGDETVVGGSQEGPGESGGEILTTGEENEQGHLTVGGWDATVTEDESNARSAVADGNLGGEEGASATVLESESNARSGGSDASTTGAELDLGGGQLHVQLLRATTSSDGEGESYILAINGEKILSSEQADGSCEIPADPLLHLLCLYAEATEGEDGESGTVAGVVDVTALDENAHGVLFEATTTQAPAGTNVAGENVSAPPAGEEQEQELAGPAAPASSGTLPVTGGGLATGLLGLLTMGAGAGLRRLTRS